MGRRARIAHSIIVVLLLAGVITILALIRAGDHSVKYVVAPPVEDDASACRNRKGTMSTAATPEPYRFDWRVDAASSWIFQREGSDHEQIRTEARKRQEDSEGETRVLTQHVIARFK